MAIAPPPLAVGPTAQIRAAVDALVAVDPSDLSDAALASELLALRREMDRQDAVFARLARAAHTRGVGMLDGAASTAAWLRAQGRMREGDARAAIEAGEVSELLAETGAAWRAGDVSTGALRMIAAARVDGHDDTYANCEPLFRGRPSPNGTPAASTASSPAPSTPARSNGCSATATSAE